MKGRDGLRIGLVALIVLAVVFSRTLATWLTDFWWYQHEGYASVFWTLLMAQLGMGLTVGVVALTSLGLTSWAVLRGRNRLNMKGPQVLEFRRSGTVPRLLPALTTLLVLILATGMGLDAASHPDLLLTFVNARDFGAVEPIFHHDIGFYIFRVPLLEYLYRGAFVLLLLCLAVSVALHFVVRTIQVVPDQFMVSPQARRQLLGLLGGLFLLKAAGYWLDTYSLLYQKNQSDLLAAPGPVLAGAAYTDVHVRLPIFYLLMLLTLACAISLWLNRLPRHWRTSLAMVTVLVLVSFSGNVILPVLTQKYVVKPNEPEREREYLQHHIDFTRMAYNLDSIKDDSFPADAGFTTAEKSANQAVLDNIPLWDHTILLKALQQAQEIRQYYLMNSVDNDRYTIDGQYRQTMLSARELSERGLPENNWITSHLSYTHGYGVSMTAANEVDPNGNPVMIVKNIPPQGPESLHLDHPQIYFGELPSDENADVAADYCFVDTASKEFDYPTSDGSAFIHYDGNGGIPITSSWQKWLYFLRFGESNILLNADIGVDSRVMFHRPVLDRVTQVTPWVTYDKDAYIVASGGQLYWIADGYTTSSYYPYSVDDKDDQLPGNYVRNSVKAIVNAYDGSMRFYVSDPTDPMIAAYAAIFPGVFQPLNAMPADLQAHLRYPQQLFDIQSSVYATFHMKDTQNFYTRQDVWQAATADESTKMKPYYAMLKLNGGDREEFVLMLPFTPASKQNMVAWMAARCDSPHYGELVAYEFPRQKNIYGPAQIKAQLNQNADISKSLTLWNQKGSHIDWGTLLVVPVGDSILYVQPLYLEATEQKTMPQLVAVIVSDGERLAMGNNLADAVNRVLGQPAAAAATTTTAVTPPPPVPSPTPGTAGNSLTWKQLVDQANQHMSDADTAQRSGDWAHYGESLKRLREDLQEMQRRGSP